jgi:hypothetical protein
MSQCFPVDHPQANLRLLLVTAAVCALLASLLSSSTGQAHLLFRLSLDGLLPSWLSVTNRWPSVPTFNAGSIQLPFLCYFCSALLSATIAYLLPTSALLRMLGVGTLFNCFVVALALLWLRFDLAEQLPLEQSQQPLHESGNCCSYGNNYAGSCTVNCCDCCCNGQSSSSCDRANTVHKVQPVVALQGSYYFERERQRQSNGRSVPRSMSDCVLQHHANNSRSTSASNSNATTTITTRTRNYGACESHHNTAQRSVAYGSADSFGMLRPEVDGFATYLNNGDRKRSVCVAYEQQSFVSLLGFDFTLNHQLPTGRSARKVKCTLNLIPKKLQN